MKPQEKKVIKKIQGILNNFPHEFMVPYVERTDLIVLLKMIKHYEKNEQQKNRQENLAMEKEKVTVKSIIENINALTQVPVESEDGNHISAEDVLALIFNEVDQLADLLGIEVED